MTEENDILFKSNGLAWAQAIVRVFLIAWTVFAIYQYHLNPNFFAITIGAAIFLFLLISETKIMVRNDYLEVKTKRIIPWLSKTKKYYFTEIKEVIYQEGTSRSPVSAITGLISPGAVVYSGRSSQIILKTKNDDYIYITPGLSENRILEIVRIVQIQISKNDAPKSMT
jgi:hypothetical protein